MPLQTNILHHVLVGKTKHSKLKELPVAGPHTLALPNFTFPSSLSSLVVTELGAPLSSSVLKRRYISLQNE